MPTIPLYQIDAFTDAVFSGNPAAVCPLKEWLPDETLRKIAQENNLSETAFFMRNDDGSYHLRWFTPTVEVKLCGHATLATAYTLFELLGHKGDKITFTGLSGDLHITKNAQGYTMNFPAWKREKADVPDIISRALGKTPREFYFGYDAIAVYDDPQDIRAMKPDFKLLAEFSEIRGVLATAPGDKDYDFISRAFFPQIGLEEDPVTGSAHCILTPYWAERLGKTRFKAHQASARGGDLFLELKGDRVDITGTAALYMKGEIYV